MFLDEIALEKDASTLMCCTLVCTAWLPRSTQLLFRVATVRVYDIAGLCSLWAAVQRSRRLSAHICLVTICLRELGPASTFGTLARRCSARCRA